MTQNLVNPSLLIASLNLLWQLWWKPISCRSLRWLYGGGRGHLCRMKVPFRNSFMRPFMQNQRALTSKDLYYCSLVGLIFSLKITMITPPALTWRITERLSVVLTLTSQNSNSRGFLRVRIRRGIDTVGTWNHTDLGLILAFTRSHL